MNDNTQPEALRLAEILEGDYCPDWFYEQGVDEVAAELRRQHTRIAELEAQLEAIGAGGVSGPLLGRPQAMPRAAYIEFDGQEETAWHTPDQMRAFADRTHALRMEQAAPKAAPGGPDGFGSAEHWKEKAQYWAGVAHRLRGEALRGEPVDGIVHPPAPQQEVQEPVAWRLTNTAYRKPKHEYFEHKSHAEVRQEQFNQSVDDGGLHNLTPLYTAPQPVVLEPLTDEQIVGVMHSIPINAAPSYHIAFARAIEAARGIKGGQHGTE